MKNFIHLLILLWIKSGQNGRCLKKKCILNCQPDAFNNRTEAIQEWWENEHFYRSLEKYISKFQKLPGIQTRPTSFHTTWTNSPKIFNPELSKKRMIKKKLFMDADPKLHSSFKKNNVFGTFPIAAFPWPLNRTKKWFKDLFKKHRKHCLLFDPNSYLFSEVPQENIKNTVFGTRTKNSFV